MGNASVKLILRRDKVRGDGKVPVYLRITQARRSRQRATGVWIEPKEWNPAKQEVRKSHPLYKSYNAQLEDDLNKARTAALGAPTVEAVAAAIDGGKGTFTAYLKTYVAALRAEGNNDLAYSFEGMGKKVHGALRTPWPDGVVPWAALTPSAVDRFARYCKADKENHSNTVRKELIQLQSVCRQAVREGVLRAEGNPFLRYTIPKKAATVRRRLSLGEIEKLRNAELEWGTTARIVRDAFLVAIYAHGIRVSDLLTLKASNVSGVAAAGVAAAGVAAAGVAAASGADGGGPRIRYAMQKTGKRMEPKIPPVAVEVLRPYLTDPPQPVAKGRRRGRYLFPLMQPGDDADRAHLRRRQKSAVFLFNKYLRHAGEAAEIDTTGLSSHVARHSFADVARKSGDLYAVSKALGHSSLAVTQQYLASFDRAAVDALTDSLWEDR